MASQLSRLIAAALILFVLLSGGSSPTAPAVVAAGDPSLVSPASGDHYAPDVAALPGGGAIVVWQSAAGPAQSSEILARRLAPDGAPIGQPFRVNQTTAGQQRRPAVAALSGGGFVVVWDTDTRTVWARRFGADGTPRDPEDLPVSGAGPGDLAHYDADVVALPGGGFAVAWETSAPGGSILLRRFGPDGAPVVPAESPHPAGGAPFKANPALAAAADGALALAWEEDDQAGGFAIRISRYDAAGALTATARPVIAGPDELRDPALALGEGGVASVVWAALPGGSPAASRIELRRLDAAGEPLGPPRLLSNAAPAARGAPTIASGAWGAVAAWPDRTTLQGEAPVGLAALSLTAGGAPVGSERYPRLPASGGEAAVVATAATAEGAWLVWSEQTVGERADLQGAVYARQLDPGANVVPPAEGPRPSVYLPLLSRP